jgi:DNA-binding GntR family transcriptional regulator
VLKPAKPINMTDHIREVVATDIHEGRLLPGDALDEAQLAERFEVSRTPIREALLQLSAQGLVKIIPRSGIYVARLSLPELFAMFELLAELEGVCAKMAARRMNRDEVAALKAAHEAAKPAVEARDADAYAIANARFHEVLYNGCHNPFLKSQIEFIRKRTKVYRQNLFARTARIAISHQDHGRVLKAIEDGDPEAALKHMLDHIGVGGRDFTEYLSTSAVDLFESPTYGSAATGNQRSGQAEASRADLKG